MAEETTGQETTGQETEQPQAGEPVSARNAQPTGAEPGQQTEAARTFSQTDVDRIVAERIERERRKGEEQARKATEAAERKAAEEQGKFQELYQKAQADLERLAAEKRGLELAALRRDVAAKFQLPDGLAKRLQGETVEELERDAQDLLAAIPKPAAPNINAGNAPARVNGNVYGGLSEKEFAARFGVRADLLGK